MHCRNQIRQALVTAFETLDTYPVRVFAVSPNTPEELPCYAVYTPGGNITNSYGGVIEHDTRVIVDVYTKGSTAVDDADNQAVIVEETARSVLDNLPIMNYFMSRQTLQVTEDGAQKAAYVSTEFSVQYRTQEDNPETFVN